MKTCSLHSLLFVAITCFLLLSCGAEDNKQHSQEEIKKVINESRERLGASSLSSITSITVKSIVSEMEAMDVIVVDSWSEDGIVYIKIDDSGLNFPSTFANYFCPTVKNGGYKGIVLRNKLNVSVGRAYCR